MRLDLIPELTWGFILGLSFGFNFVSDLILYLTFVISSGMRLGLGHGLKELS